ncbi:MULTISPECIES: hypothetical protein [unclassified Streptomyces]|uniref:hypothetical protein n=1 Tax=unclassified Streptomyces TaxID=2593676 RepID=UPI0022524FC8|nr:MULTISPECIES: hypothetical protein [unclassified Streptomyces]MCX4976521.1 hypothetical protein [Streptomyces sp. NBC_00620]WRZ24388.1 hypothetical protein OHT59_40670 [Streptomyces sp. NBC_00243]
MTERMTPLDLDEELPWLRTDAAALLADIEPAGTVSEQVKALEGHVAIAQEFARRFTSFDVAATASRDAPHSWRRGYELSGEQVPALLEQYPGVAEALGTRWVRALAAVGLTPSQMAALVCVQPLRAASRPPSPPRAVRSMPRAPGRSWRPVERAAAVA